MARKKKLRNDALIEYWLLHKDDENYGGYRQIGQIFGDISKQRVQELLCLYSDEYKEKRRELVGAIRN